MWGRATFRPKHANRVRAYASARSARLGPTSKPRIDKEEVRGGRASLFARCCCACRRSRPERVSHGCITLHVPMMQTTTTGPHVLPSFTNQPILIEHHCTATPASPHHRSMRSDQSRQIPRYRDSRPVSRIFGYLGHRVPPYALSCSHVL